MATRAWGAAAVAGVLLALPACALGWGETVTRNEPGGGPATCLRHPGADALSLVGPVARRSVALDLLHGGGRLAGPGRADFGIVGDCPGVAVNDDGAAVMAAFEFGSRRE